MKKTFFKSLMALCVSAMTLTAVSTSCGKLEEQLNSEVSNLQGQINDLDARLTEVEQKLTAKLDALTQRVDALYTLQFSVNDKNELLYSFDGGKNWVSTGIVLVNEEDLLKPEDVPGLCPPCQYVPCTHECPQVSLVDNGTSVTISVNDATFTIEKPLEVEFEVKGGRVYFQPSESKTIAFKSTAIEEMFVLGVPEGWEAEVVDGGVEVVAPVANENYYGWGSPVVGDQTGFVKVAGIASDGRTLVGKASVCASNTCIAVFAYADTAHFEVTSDSGAMYYYGACKKSEYDEVIAEFMNAAYNYNPDILEKYGMWYESLSVPVSHLLGTEDAPVEPEAGVEYVVWAYLEANNTEYKVEEVAYTSYQKVEVDFEVTEVQAFDVDIRLSVSGADSYMVVSVPEDQYMGPEFEYSTHSNMVGSVQNGQTYGVILDSDYEGSIYDVCANTSFSATGNAGLGKTCYLLVLPLDGRPVDAYTVADVYTFSGKCANASQGGNVTLQVEQVYEYDNYGEMAEVNIYNDIYLQVTPSEGWYALYNMAMTDEQLAEYSGMDALIAEDVVANSWPMLAADQPAGSKSLIVPFTELGQDTEINYVAVAVDKDGKYSQVYKMKFKTSKIEYSEILKLTATAPETITSTDVTLTVTTEGTASDYRYVCFAEDNSTWRYTYGRDPEAAIMALVTNDYSSWSNPSVNVAKAEWTGSVELTGLAYDKKYYFFVCSWDEAGNPAVAQCEFTPEFQIGTLVAKDTEAWTAAQPSVITCDFDGSEVNMTLKPAENTTISIFANTTSYLGSVSLDDSEGLIKALFNTVTSYYRTVMKSDGTNVFGYYKFADADGDGIWTRTSYARGESIKLIYAVQLADGSYCEPVVVDVPAVKSE